MELKEFISHTLFEIQEGVQDAIAKARDADTRGVINPAWEAGGGAGSRHIREVSFDIAVTVSEQSSDRAGGGIKVMGIGVGSELAGSTESSHVSRIQFNVPVIPPVTIVKDNGIS